MIVAPMLLAPQGSSSAAVAIVPGASPYTYTATQRGVVFVSAGTVSLLEYGRAGVFQAIGALTGGMFEMNAGDTLRTTYVVAPSMTFLPR
jgi:hypothetical protein